MLRAFARGMFRDGFGERRQITTATDRTEMLCLRGELTSVPSFEFALRERVSHLASFRHAYYGRVRSVERLNDSRSTLAIVSDQVPGARLSDIIAAAETKGFALDINASLCLIRQIVPAVAVLQASQVSHGAIAAERILVTPNARVVLVEYVLGSALEQLRYSQERYWKELRVATARVGGIPRFDERTDVTAIGALALSLIVGRPLGDDEFPARLPEVLGSAWAISARGGYEPLPAGLRAWLSRALQLDARQSFTTVGEAQAELDRVIGDSDFLAAPAAIEAVLSQYLSFAPHEEAAPPVAAPLPQAVNETPRMPEPIAAAVAPPARTVVPAPAIETPRSPEPVARQASAPVARTIPPPVLAAPKEATPAAAAISPIAASPVAAASARPSSLPVASEVASLADLVAAAPKQAPWPAPKPAHDPFAAPNPLAPPPKTQTHEADEADDEPAAGLDRWKGLAVVAVLVLAVLAGGAFAARQYATRSARSATGTVAVTTTPAGAQLLVDGVMRGTTPVTLALAPGPHTLVVRGDGEPRTIPITVTAGAQVSQYLDLPKAAVASGQLQVRTEPAGAQVSIDGVPRGASPVTAGDLAPGEHTVTVAGELGKIEQTVSVTAGTMSSLVVPLNAPKGAPVSGWISVSAASELQIYEGGKLLGSSQMDRLMMPTGSHQLELVNESIGYRATKTVQVAPGRVAAMKIDFPKGTVALNAIPWADVWIDGEKAGQTPLGNISVALGTHEVVFRNPDLGEQKHTVVVTATAPARLSVDLRKK